MSYELTESHPLDSYLDRTETLFCPGCGNGVILNAIARAIHELYDSTEKLVAVSGIGCAGWIPSPHLKLDRIHTTHGRAIAFATGIKLANPKLKVMVISGDGDIAGIGGNHLIHAARRNMELSVFMVNNYGYAMTGGQHGPTTPHEAKTVTTPYGNIEVPFDSSALVAAAGASYVARWTVAHVRQLNRAVRNVLQYGEKGFAFLEIVSSCPTRFGKRIFHKSALEMLIGFRETSINIKKLEDLEPEDHAGKIVVGEFVTEEKPGYVAQLYDIIERARK
ncbi:MAG: thiamine pyrophosphate-dependent enzyme [Candidatus Heimdallarchaeota archaeon]